MSFWPIFTERDYIKLWVSRGVIKRAKINMGWHYRSIERLVIGKSVSEAHVLIRKICGICSLAHSMAFVRTIEGMIELQVPERAQYLRVTFSELERISSHLLALSVLFDFLGEDSRRFLLERDRIHEFFKKLCGARVHPALSEIGGVNFDVKGLEDRILEMCDVIKEIASEAEELLKGKKDELSLGFVPREIAEKYAVGPFARASGVSCDVRVHKPYFAYEWLNPREVIEEGCDCFSRAMVRIRELEESTRLILKALDEMPPQGLKCEAPSKFSGTNEGEVEAPRGANTYWIKVKDGVIKEIKIRTPTLKNFRALERCLPGERIENVEKLLICLDPCYSCTDRILVVRE